MTFSLVPIRSSSDATCMTPASVMSGVPTRPKPIDPKKEIFTPDAPADADPVITVSVSADSCSDCDACNQGMAVRRVR